MSKPTPPLSERQKPGLSRTLTYQRHPEICQGCGEHQHDVQLRRWRECDAWDKPTRRVVVLCEPCSKREIDKHPRLYIALQPNEPAIGTMRLCIDCTWRRGVDCAHPDAKPNGGAGLKITSPKPIAAFLCPGGLTRLWQPGTIECAGRTEAASVPPAVSENPGPDPTSPDTKTPV